MIFLSITYDSNFYGLEHRILLRYCSKFEIIGDGIRAQLIDNYKNNFIYTVTPLHAYIV